MNLGKLMILDVLELAGWWFWNCHAFCQHLSILWVKRWLSKGVHAQIFWEADGRDGGEMLYMGIIDILQESCNVWCNISFPSLASFAGVHQYESNGINSEVVEVLAEEKLQVRNQRSRCTSHEIEVETCFITCKLELRQEAIDSFGHLHCGVFHASSPLCLQTQNLTIEM